MKVGTDAILLGAWASLDAQPESILDIGSGTGILALQMARRSQAIQIDAVEIDHDAYEQCVENFENSPWSDRLFCYHASIQEFVSEIDEAYDLIISNPPYFSEDIKTNDDARNKARFTDALPFDHLLICAAHLLTPEGSFQLILPKSEEEAFIELAATIGLHPKRICHVKGTQKAEIKRILLELTRKKEPVTVSELIIETERHKYTPEFVALTREFYLDM